jgi:hypothetical protein
VLRRAAPKIRAMKSVSAELARLFAVSVPTDTALDAFTDFVRATMAALTKA